MRTFWYCAQTSPPDPFPPSSCCGQHFLDVAGAEVPALIEGLHLADSVALDGFRPHSSDVDFFVVTANRLDAGSHVRQSLDQTVA
jgi:hypothetical protein